ncbi:MAG: alpha/beta hydrolase family protein [Chthonomonadetes bacterium]|nr:alpha/beta hydrolase family protein [Chthonomonadetes bacterium]
MKRSLLVVFGLMLWGGQSLAQSASDTWFHYPPQPVAAEVVRLHDSAENTHLLVRFPSLMKTPQYPQNQTVFAEVFVPNHGQRMPAVVILHSWGVQKPDIELSLARTLARRGFVTAVMTLPYHIQRTPSGYLSGELMIVPDVEHMRTTMRQAVLDTMRLVDWLQSQPQVASDRLGIVGISLGAIVSALVLGVENRLQAGVLVLGGANLAHVLWRSPLTLGIRSELRGKGIGYERLREELLSVEPLHFLRGQYGDRVLMINGRYDMVIPREDADALRRALGEGPILWLNTGHYGPALVRSALFGVVQRFLSAKLQDDSEPFVLPSTLREPTLRIGLLYSGVWGARVSVAVDVWRWEREGRAGVAVQASPRNLSVLVGFRPLSPLHIGLELSSRPAAGYVFFHFVL